MALWQSLCENAAGVKREEAKRGRCDHIITREVRLHAFYTPSEASMLFLPSDQAESKLISFCNVFICHEKRLVRLNDEVRRCQNSTQEETSCDTLVVAFNDDPANKKF